MNLIFHLSFAFFSLLMISESFGLPLLKHSFHLFFPKQNYDSEMIIQDIENVPPENVVNSIVSIKTPDGKLLGNGFLVNSDGLIVTNAHVVGVYPEVNVELHDGRSFSSAKVIAFHPNSSYDLAAVEIQGVTGLASVLDDASEAILENDSIFFFDSRDGTLPGPTVSGTIKNLIEKRHKIEFDSSIDVNPGHSGSALFNEDWKLIGIIKSKNIISGSGNAISVDLVRDFVETYVITGNAPNRPLQLTSICSPQSQEIEVSDIEIEGRLDSSDLSEDGSYFNSYHFQAQAQQIITIEMTTEDRKFYPYLTLETEGGEVIGVNENNDLKNDLRISEVTIPSSGIYCIFATSLLSLTTGDYRLRLFVEPILELREEGLFFEEEEASFLSPGNLYKDYEFLGEAGQRVTILAVSEELKTALQLRGSSGQIIQENRGNYFGDLNSIITLNLPADGRYQVRVISDNISSEGRFNLTIRNALTEE
ncbi:trypsin-like peptidase domain-containing protein [Nodosilinea sp. LEGE 07298]|uniref:S1 family peptidase n=1 Tax=Nodosilinea sp. LEGE 07298 TaxID=2777970 RepID=UPI00187F124F|nr:serine protease [Nodosilinea sp. LEGE 07298]MBE9108549.1 trypsin-like peptidase domain-containing protein [Nodosilinea sp. LEGE 07298]